MSANRDRNQRVAFVYSNFYQIYQKGKQAATEAPSIPSTGMTSAVIKAGDRREVETFQPLSLLVPKQTRGPAVLEEVKPTAAALSSPLESADKMQIDALKSLKDNMKSLNDLHSRLRFMLKELEELVREE